jgi:hypothetical protein
MMAEGTDSERKGALAVRCRRHLNVWGTA